MGVRRLLLSPTWWLRHLFAVVCLLAFLRLGWWQWDRAHDSDGTPRYFLYALEWVVFAGFVGFMWWHMVRDEIRGEDGAPSAVGPVTRPASGGTWAQRAANGTLTDGGAVTTVDPGPEIEEEDPDDPVVAYNRYLASLYERDAERERRRLERQRR